VIDFQQLLVDFLFPRRFDVDQDESDGREATLVLRKTVL
jgi:hypothetical protein